MRTLVHTEQRFQDFVMRGATAIADEIVSTNNETLNVRIGIYYDAYRSRLVEVLGNDFEVLRHYIGEDAFDALARAYVDSHPSRFRNVRWFGEQFADFIATRPECPDRLVASEVARFEWTIGLAFDAHDAPVVTFDELATISPDAWADIGFVTHPSLHLVEFHTNAPDVWSNHKEHGQKSEGTALEAPSTYAIWRVDEMPRYRPIEPDELWAANATRDGATFGDLCEGLCEFVSEDEAPMRAATLMQEWVRSQWITAVRGVR